MVGNNPIVKRNLMIKIAIIILLILVLIYLIAANITQVRNQGGNNKAIFLVILTAISLAENYFLFLPILCFIKTKILMTYGAYTSLSSRFVWSLKYMLFIFFITDVDRAIFKELKECVKNNAEGEEDKPLTSHFESSKIDEDDRENDPNISSPNNRQHTFNHRNPQIEEEKNSEVADDADRRYDTPSNRDLHSINVVNQNQNRNAQKINMIPEHVNQHYFEEESIRFTSENKIDDEEDEDIPHHDEKLKKD